MTDIVYRKEVVLPDGLQFSAAEDTVTISDGKKEVSRKFDYLGITLGKEDDRIVIACVNPKKKEKALVGTYTAHVRNMLKGITEGFEYTLKVIYSHFPVKTRVQGNEFIIENFLGEKHPRRAKILKDVQVRINGDMVSVKGIDKEKVGQTCANIESATVVKNFDIRVFQDGIYITSKGGE